MNPTNMENFLAMRRTPNDGLFTDNLIMQTTSEFSPDGCTFGPVHTDPDYAKGIYNLRPRSGTLGPAFPKHDTDMPQTAKGKRPRNSLRKRLLVNARERERMRVLNNAFQSLRDALPCYIADGHMAKITTLRLAINYIKALTEVLNDDGSSSRCAPAISMRAGVQARPAITAAPAPFPEPVVYAPPAVHHLPRMFMPEEFKGPKF